MRSSRMLVLGFAGLLALHVYMLAGHGRSHDAAMGAPVMGEHAGAAAVASQAPAMPGGHDAAGIDMTVACLAVLAGLLLLAGWRQPAAASPPATGRSPDPIPGGTLHLADVSRPLRGKSAQSP